MKRAVAALSLALLACSRAPESSSLSSQAVSAHPSASVKSPTDDWPERYRGKPILVVIENYALSVVGVLPASKEVSVRQIVTRTFGGGDDWRATVRTTMAWPANIDAEILANWQSFTKHALEQGIPVDPTVFARAFADEFSKY